VQIDPRLWAEEVERFERSSRARVAGERERPGLESSGVELAELRACAEHGTDGTRLGGLFKIYVPISAGPASERPFGFILRAVKGEAGSYLRLVAFGDRHPGHGRSVYERAQRLHGRYPDEGR
jgi:hypothetical protein